jgi:oxygen-dependent protoporphyrinogen oxidase
MPHVVIVGGGLSGLSVAFRLRRAAPGVAVTVLESGPRPGGKVGTEDRDGFRFETGPNGFLDSKPAVPDLCRDLGIAGRLIPASEAARTNRYLFLGGQLRKLPRGPLGLLASPLLSLRGKLRLLSEPFRRPRRAGGVNPRSLGTDTPGSPAADESVAEFVTRRAGKEAADVFADALVTGIHGGDPALLSVAAAFPRLPEMEREAGGIIRGFLRAAKERRREAQARGEQPPGPQRMWSFREGLRALIDALADQSGATIHTGVRVKSVSSEPGLGGPGLGEPGVLTPGAGARWRVHAEGRDAWSADAVVLTCPAHDQAAILADLDRELADEIAGIPYNRIAVVALGYRAADCPRPADGFGYIAPQNTRRDVLGVQWCSSIFPDRAPPGCVLWRALCGGVHRGEVVDWDDDTLARAVHAEVRLAMGVTGGPVFRRVVRWPAAIPQYVIGHPDRVARVESLAARHPGLVLAGAPFRGVAMADCAGQAEPVAAQVAAFLTT